MYAGCIRDVVAEQDGYLYSPSDPDGLIEALRRAVAERHLVAEKGERARQRVLEWSWQAVAGRTLAVYEETLGRSASSVERRTPKHERTA